MTPNGKLNFDPVHKVWGVWDLRPHVAMAFKRLFPRVREAETRHVLADSDAVRADLHWFMMRYPLEHKWETELLAGVERMERRAASRAAVLLPTWKSAGNTGFREGEKPYIYQEQAAALAIEVRGLLLGDDVGLGKTVSTLATAAGGAPLPMAIVVQSHLVRQWERQANRFTNLRVHAVKSREIYTLPEADLYIFRYSILGSWIDVFTNGTFRSVAYDEIQELRHGSTTVKGRGAAVLSGKAELRLGLSATPIFNYGAEMFNIMNFVEPGLLGSYDEFYREWCPTGKIVKDPDALGSYLRETGHMLARDEHDETVDQAMPPANILEWPVGYDEDEVKADESLMQKLALSVLRGSFSESGRAARELDVRLRQITGIAKARSVAVYVKMLMNEVPRVLIGAWHREVYTILLEELAEFNPCLYTGTETAAGKDRSAKAFIAGDSIIMMMSLRSGSGLDGIQECCDDAVMAELDWSPQVHKQFLGRLRRPPNMRQVTGHFLHTDWGSDPVLLELLGIKSDQSRGLMRPGLAAAPKVNDDARIKRLAKFVLEGGE